MIMHKFPLSQIRILAGAFHNAEERDIAYMLQMMPDRLLAPYRAEAGLTPKAPGYPGWEREGLNGHTAGHYVSALANLVAGTQRVDLRERLDYMLAELAECQRAHGDGYLGGIPGSRQLWDQLRAGHIDTGNFGLNGKWVPWYNIHKIFAGLRDAYLVAGCDNARSMFIALCDWCVALLAPFTDAQMQTMLKSEYGGMNEVLADAAALTGDDKYLAAARRFCDDKLLRPLMRGEDPLTGMHANTQIPKVIGYQRIAECGGGAEWSEAAVYFWKNVVRTRTVATGGHGVREMFHHPKDFAALRCHREGNETCNTYNMLRLSGLLFAQSRDLAYLDYYERAIYNHVLSSQHPGHGGLVYFTQIRPRHYRVYSQPETAFWCCVGTGIENHTKYGEWIYSHDDSGLYVNFFIPSHLDWTEKGVALTQETRFPDEETSRLKLALAAPQEFALHIRHPKWIPAGRLTVRINGEAQAMASRPGEYLPLRRVWRDGDVVELALPMSMSLELLPDGTPWGAFVYGPIVLAAKAGDAEIPGLLAGEKWLEQMAQGPLYSQATAPMVLAADPVAAATLPRRVSGRALAFRLEGLGSPEESLRELELVPFHTVHDARYMLYWRVTPPADYPAVFAKLNDSEEAALELDAQTVDSIALGEQQPENDHNFFNFHRPGHGTRGEGGAAADELEKPNKSDEEQIKAALKDEQNFLVDDTLFGFDGHTWRRTNSWMSCDFTDPQGLAKSLCIHFAGTETAGPFDLFLDDVKVTEVKTGAIPAASAPEVQTLQATHRGAYVEEYLLPPEALGVKGVRKFRITATSDKKTDAIYAIRLMR